MPWNTANHVSDSNTVLNAVKYDKIDCIVNSCTAYTVLFTFHPKVKLLCIEVLVNRIHFIQYGKPLRCFAAAAFFEVLCKDLSYRILGALLFHVRFKSRNNKFCIES